MSEKNWKTRLLTSSVFAGAIIASVALPAIAQTEDEPVATTAPAATEDEARQEKITVTGSRLASANFTGTSPVTSVSAEAIELSATLSVETLLNELPQVIPGNTYTSNNAGGEDFATIDLRGLGPSRSLVLINGERVPASSISGVVDLNSIPPGLLDRVEVLTGGASAVYGSDAVAGVVNFILKEDYEGAQFTVGTGGAFDGNAQYENFDFLVGGNFDNGKGNLTTYGSYYNRDGVKQSAYDYAKTSATLLYGYDTTTGEYAAYGIANSSAQWVQIRDALAAQYGFAATLASGGSVTPPWGQIVNSTSNPFQNLATNPATAGQFAGVNSDCNPATAVVNVNGGNLSFNDQGQLTPYFSAGACSVPDRAAGSSRYNFAPDNFIVLPAERLGLQSIGTYQVTDDIKLKGFFSYVKSETQVQLAPSPLAQNFFSVNPNNAWAITGTDGVMGTADDPHPDLSAALLSRPNPNASFAYGWRSSALGPRIGNYTNDSFIARVSAEGEISETWDWNLSVGYGRSTLSDLLENNLSRVALEQGVAGCSTVTSGRLPGCVDVDIFGPPSIVTPAMANFLTTDTQSKTEVEQISVSGFVRGDLIQLPAGPMSIVAGLEYRQDDVERSVDDALRRGEIVGFNGEQNVLGSVDVYEAYAETLIPILSDLPFAHDLSLEIGGRISDYSSVGEAEALKIGLNYAPTDWVRLRAVFNNAVRAPSASELFLSGNQGFPSYSDPCRFQATNPNPALLAFCTTNGNIGGGFVPLASAPTFTASNSQVQAFAFGNPDLEPETGETFTAGIVFEPDFLPIGRFRGSVDYFQITLEDAVVSRGASTILSSCYSNLGVTAQSAIDCQRIVRDPSGQIFSVDTTLINLADTIEIAGTDIQLDYNIDLDEVFKGAPGTLNLNTLVTLTDKYDFAGTRVEGTTTAGIGGATPDWKTSTTLDYRLDDWTFQVRHQYVPSLIQEVGDFFGFPPLPDQETPEFSNFDFSTAWDVNDRFRVVGTVSNVMDELPPQTELGLFDQANTDAALYAPWVIGRTFSVSARLKF